MDKIICVGKNYSDHVREMGGQPDAAEAPVLFLKPPSVLVEAPSWGRSFQTPLFRNGGEIHHECEIVVKLRAGQIEAVTLGLDMTRREVQAALKKEGKPWTISKVFPGSALIAPWISVLEFSDYLSVPFRFSVNGKLRQQTTGDQMLFSPTKCIAHAAQFFPVCDGDLLFTGTPSGVGAVQPGDRAKMEWGQKSLELEWI